mgnify:FL=1
MKTAMEELLNDTFKGIVKELGYYLELEKKQIEDAFYTGEDNDEFVYASQYYDKTYSK